MADKKKLPSTFINMLMSLSVIAIGSALALGFTYTATKDAIAQVQVQKTLAALKTVLPEFDNKPDEEKYSMAGDEFSGLEFFPAKKEGQLVGTAVRTYSDNGFSERIWLMAGFDSSLKVINISVLQQKETPGLGTKIQKPKFLNQFIGKDPGDFKVKVKKDGGDVDAISAATISSRAFCEAVDRGYSALKKGGHK